MVPPSGKPGAGCLTEGGRPRHVWATRVSPCLQRPAPPIADLCHHEEPRTSFAHSAEPSSWEEGSPPPPAATITSVPRAWHISPPSLPLRPEGLRIPRGPGGWPPGWACPPGMTPASWGGAPGLPRGDASTNVCASFQGLMLGLWRTSNSALLDLTLAVGLGGLVGGGLVLWHLGFRVRRAPSPSTSSARPPRTACSSAASWACPPSRPPWAPGTTCPSRASPWGRGCWRPRHRVQLPVPRLRHLLPRLPAQTHLGHRLRPRLGPEPAGHAEARQRLRPAAARTRPLTCARYHAASVAWLLSPACAACAGEPGALPPGELLLPAPAAQAVGLRSGLRAPLLGPPAGLLEPVAPPQPPAAPVRPAGHPPATPSPSSASPQASSRANASRCAWFCRGP